MYFVVKDILVKLRKGSYQTTNLRIYLVLHLNINLMDFLRFLTPSLVFYTRRYSPLKRAYF